MSRKELCPICHKSLKGLYENNRNLYEKYNNMYDCDKRESPKEKANILRAYYCPKCNKVFSFEDAVHKQVNYVKNKKRGD